MSRRTTVTRRTVVAALSAAVAGCASGGDDSTTDETTAGTTVPESTERSTTRPRETTEPPSSPEGAARALVIRLSERRFRDAVDLFADDLSAQVSAVGLQREWARQASSLGGFDSISDVERRSDPPQAVVVVRVAFAGGERLARVVTDGEGRVTGLLFLRPYSPPDYADRSAFAEREVTLAGDCDLPGTVAVPAGDGPFPGVVVVHGSGPQDRDGTLGGNKAYRDLAWGLASRGTAVLRYDKRTTRCSVPPEAATVDRVVTADALAAVEKLRGADAVRSDGVFVVGHSLGGAVAPRIAERDGDLAGIAMLAANARPTYQLLPEQHRYLAELDGRTTEAERRRIERYEAAVHRIDEGEADPGETVTGAPARFWYSLKEYDQVETAAALTVPRFVCQGERDYQVSPERDFERWRSALGGEATFRLYDGLNHLFVAGERPSTPAKQLRSGNVAEQVVADLRQWIGNETG